MESILMAVLGGVLIGLAASLMLIFNGRVTGISGIVNGIMTSPQEGWWRGTFMGGLILGGFLIHVLKPELFENLSGRSSGQIIVAGFIVGFGTVLGSGCTSGHGVCGLARLSPRSFYATLTFIAFGMLTASGVKYLLGGM